MLTTIFVIVVAVVAVRLFFLVAGRVKAGVATVRGKSHWIWIAVAVVVAISFAAHR